MAILNMDVDTETELSSDEIKTLVNAVQALGHDVYYFSQNVVDSVIDDKATG